VQCGVWEALVFNNGLATTGAVLGSEVPDFALLRMKRPKPTKLLNGLGQK